MQKKNQIKRMLFDALLFSTKIIKGERNTGRLVWVTAITIVLVWILILSNLLL